MITKGPPMVSVHRVRTGKRDITREDSLSNKIRLDSGACKDTRGYFYN